MKKENEWTNGGKKIEGKEGGKKKKGYDVPMDEQNAHPNLKQPSNPEVADQPVAMKWVDNNAPVAEETEKAPKKEEKAPKKEETEKAPKKEEAAPKKEEAAPKKEKVAPKKEEAKEANNE